MKKTYIKIGNDEKKGVHIIKCDSSSVWLHNSNYNTIISEKEAKDSKLLIIDRTK